MTTPSLEARAMEHHLGTEIFQAIQEGKVWDKGASGTLRFAHLSDRRASGYRKLTVSWIKQLKSSTTTESTKAALTTEKVELVKQISSLMPTNQVIRAAVASQVPSMEALATKLGSQPDVNDFLIGKVQLIQAALPQEQLPEAPTSCGGISLVQVFKAVAVSVVSIGLYAMFTAARAGV